MSEPFYERDGITLYCDNCVNAMAGMEDNSVDSVITDPPYGLSGKVDIAAVLEHWLEGKKYTPGSVRKGRKNCIANILDRAIVNNPNNTQPVISQEGITFSIQVSLLGMKGRGVNFDNDLPIREKEVNDKSAAVPFKDMLMDKANSCLAQLFSDGHFMLRKSEGFSGCVGVCTCFTKTGKTSYSINVRLSNDALTNAEASTDVMTFVTTEMSLVLTLDLTRRTGELLATYGTGQDNAFIELVSTQLVGTSTRASGLSSPLKAGNISSIDSLTDGACTFNLLTHSDLLERLDNPIISQKGFMSKKWDAIVPGPHIWREVYRVLKPGGTLLCFAGARTQDLMGIALRLARFEVKDVLMYVYGSGFMKALDIGKKLDAMKGMERESTGFSKSGSRQHSTWQRGDSGVFQPNAGHAEYDAPASPEAQLWDGWKSHSIKPAYEPIIIAMKPNEKNYALNALEWGVSGLWVDGVRIESTQSDKDALQSKMGVWTKPETGIFKGIGQKTSPPHPLGRCPSNIILDGSEQVEALFPETTSGGSGQHHASSNSLFVGTGGNSRDISDSGSASRYFQHCPPDPPLTEEAQRLFYCAKSSKAERNAGLEGMEKKSTEDHNLLSSSFRNDPRSKKGGYENKPAPPQANTNPCVKPLSLMRYLTRISRTPTGGVVLDPFMGSGTTGVACVYEERDFIGMDLDADYCEIGKRRIIHAQAQPKQPSFWSIPSTPPPAEVEPGEQRGLFEDAEA